MSTPRITIRQDIELELDPSTLSEIFQNADQRVLCELAGEILEVETLLDNVDDDEICDYIGRRCPPARMKQFIEMLQTSIGEVSFDVSKMNSDDLIELRKKIDAEEEKRAVSYVKIISRSPTDWYQIGKTYQVSATTKLLGGKFYYADNVDEEMLILQDDTILSRKEEM